MAYGCFQVALRNLLAQVSSSVKGASLKKEGGERKSGSSTIYEAKGGGKTEL